MGRFRPYSREMTSLLHSSPRLPPNHLTKVTQWECHKKALDSLVLNSKLYQWAFVLLYDGEEDRKKYCTGE